MTTQRRYLSIRAWEDAEPEDEISKKRKYFQDDLLDYFFNDTPDEEIDDFSNQATQTKDIYEHVK